MAATLKDVAQMANVSLTTASHALNGKKVKDETRERVVKAAQMLKYYPNINGKTLITKKTNNISIVILDSRSYGPMLEVIQYYYEFLQGAMICAQKKGYSLNFEAAWWEDLAQSDYFERKLYSNSIDGIIIIPQYNYRCDFLIPIENENFPCVIINPAIKSGKTCVVNVDNVMGGKLAADFLLDRGHKSIKFINGPIDHIDSIARESGFCSRLLMRGVKFNRDEIVYSDFTNQGGFDSMIKLLSDKSGIPSAVFCANDYMAAGAISATLREGYGIPEDISIMGYDGTDISNYTYPKLTTIRCDVKDLGYKAVSGLIKTIEDPTHPVNYVIEPAVLERESVKRI